MSEKVSAHDLDYNAMTTHSDGRVMRNDEKKELRAKHGYCETCQAVPVLLYTVKKNLFHKITKVPIQSEQCGDGICYVCEPYKNPNWSKRDPPMRGSRQQGKPKARPGMRPTPNPRQHKMPARDGSSAMSNMSSSGHLSSRGGSSSQSSSQFNASSTQFTGSSSQLEPPASPMSHNPPIIDAVVTPFVSNSPTPTIPESSDVKSHEPYKNPNQKQQRSDNVSAHDLDYNVLTRHPDGRVMRNDEKKELRAKHGYCETCQAVPVLLYTVKRNKFLKITKVPEKTEQCGDGICYVCEPYKNPNQSKRDPPMRGSRQQGKPKARPGMRPAPNPRPNVPTNRQRKRFDAPNFDEEASRGSIPSLTMSSDVSTVDSHSIFSESQSTFSGFHSTFSGSQSTFSGFHSAFSGSHSTFSGSQMMKKTQVLQAEPPTLARTSTVKKNILIPVGTRRLGLSIVEKDGRKVIRNVDKDSPIHDQVRIGDVILAFDGLNVTDLALEDLSELMISSIASSSSSDSPLTMVVEGDIDPPLPRKPEPAPTPTIATNFDEDASRSTIPSLMMSDISTMQHLDLSSSQIDDDGVKELAIALQSNTSLERLNASYNRIGDEGAKALANVLRSNTSLQHLDLGSNQIEDEGAKELAIALQSNTSLERFYFSNNRFGDEGAKALANVLQSNTSLRVLYLQRNQIGGEGAMTLANALQSNLSLRVLHLYGNQIGVEGAKALATALQSNTSLRELHAEENQIGDEGAKAFANALQSNTALRKLNVKGNEIGADGTKALANALESNTILRELVLEGNDIDAEGAQALANALQSNTTLRKLNLEGNQIRATILNEIQALVNANGEGSRSFKTEFQKPIQNSSSQKDKVDVPPFPGSSLRDLLDELQGQQDRFQGGGNKSGLYDGLSVSDSNDQNALSSNIRESSERVAAPSGSGGGGGDDTDDDDGSSDSDGDDSPSNQKQRETQRRMRMREALMVAFAEVFELGVPVRLETYERTQYELFVGSDAVDWMVQSELASSRTIAVEIGQLLLEQLNLFQHLTKSFDFRDDYIFYKFCDVAERRYPPGYSAPEHPMKFSEAEVPQQELENLGHKFKVEVITGTHFHRNKRLDNVFSGSDAVSWMVDSSLASSRRDAVKLGQRFQEELRLFSPIRAGKKFIDDIVFFRFHEDGDPTETSRFDDSFREMNSSVTQVDSARLMRWVSSFRGVDPRRQIFDFFKNVGQIRDSEDVLAVRSSKPSFVTQLRIHGQPLSPRLFQSANASVFAVFRPTSIDAIRKMMMGQAVGKGLDIKGKSAKRGKLSAFVPFLQISRNDHKGKVATIPSSATIRIFFASRESRQSAAEKLVAVLKEMRECVDKAKERLLERGRGQEADEENQPGLLEKALLYELDTPVVDTIDDYIHSSSYGLQLPARLFWETFVVRQDIGRERGSQYDTGRPSIPSFQNKNFEALFAKSQPYSPVPVLWQNAGGDPKLSLNPFELLMAYEEHGRVFPVVSDFDAFLVGSKRISFHKPLPENQVTTLKWCIRQIKEVLAARGPENWTSRWLEKLENPTSGEKMHPIFPRFGFGDPVSYGLMEKAATMSISGPVPNGAIRHGAECFNYYFPQDLDDEFLVISEDLSGKNKWEYMNILGVKRFLKNRIRDGYTFPLNPKWILCDGWGDLYDDLMNSDRLEVIESMNTWFPLDSGVREEISEIRERYPRGFLREQRRQTVAEIDPFVAASMKATERQSMIAGFLSSIGATSSEEEIEVILRDVVKAVRETPIENESDVYEYEEYMGELLGCLSHFQGNQKISSMVFYLLEKLAGLDASSVLGNGDEDNEVHVLLLASKSLRTHTSKVYGALNTLKFMKVVIESEDVDGSVIRAARSSVGESVLHAMGTFPNSSDLQKVGLIIIVSLCRGSDDSFATMLIENSGVEIVTRAMVELEEDADIQKNACALIAQLSSFEVCHHKLGQYGAMTVLVNAIMRHPESTTLQNEALISIQNLANDASNKSRLLEIGAEDSILYSVLINLKHRSVVFNAFKALIKMMEEAVAVRQLSLSVIIASMKRHDSNEEIAEVAIELLALYVRVPANRAVMAEELDELLCPTLVAVAEKFPQYGDRATFILESLM